MDLSSERANELLYATFNQDFSCLAVGTENGFFICDTDPLKERFRRGALRIAHVFASPSASPVHGPARLPTRPMYFITMAAC